MAVSVERLRLEMDSQIATQAAQDAAALTAAATATTNLGNAMDQTDKTIRRSGPSYASVAAMIDGTAAATRRLTTIQEKHDKAVAAVVDKVRDQSLAMEEAAEQINRLNILYKQAVERAIAYGESVDNRFKGATDTVKSLAENAGAAAHQTGNVSMSLRNLGIQSIDVFQQLATGAPVMTTLIQQGSQVGQVMATSGVSFKQLAGAAVSAIAAINPFVLAASAATLVLGGFVVASEVTTKRLIDIQMQLRRTRDDYISLAKEVRTASIALPRETTLGSTESRQAAMIIAGAKEFSGSAAAIKDMVKASADLARVMGQELPEAAKTLAVAMREPGAAAKRLADDDFPGMSQALAYSIKMQAESGEKAAAFARYMEVVRAQTRGASDDMTPLGRAFADLVRKITPAIDATVSFASTIGTVMVKGITTTIDAIGWLIEKLGDAYKALKNLTDFSKTAGAVPGADITNVRRNGSYVGLFGVGPEAAAQVGIPPESRFDYKQNIAAGVKYFLWLMQQTGGDIDLATRAYNQGLAGARAGRGADYLAAVTSRDPNTIDPSVRLDILEFLRWNYRASPWSRTELPGLRDRLLQIALQESSGSHYETGMVSPARVTPRMAEDFGWSRASQLRDQAFLVAQATGSLMFRRDQNLAQQSLLGTALSLTTDPDEIKRLTEALAVLKGQESELITEQEKLARSSTDVTKALSAQSGFAREMAQVEAQFEITARKSGEAVDAKALAIAKAARAMQLAREFEDTVDLAERTAEAQYRIARAYDGTTESLSRAQNLERAAALAREKYQEGTEQYAAAVERYAAALERGADAARMLEQAQKSAQAVLDMFGNAMDRLGQALVDVFVSGRDSALNFGRVVKGIVVSIITDVAKLGIINPLMNDLLGSQVRPTLQSGLGALVGGGGGVLNILFGGGTSGGGGSSPTGSLNIVGGSSGTASGLLGSGNNLFTMLGISDFLGITNVGGWLKSTLGFGSGSGGIGGFLSSGVFQPIHPGTALLDSMGINAGQGSLSSLTWGQLIGGVGLGFGAGSLLGGFIQRAFNKVGPGPMIGSGVGAVGGTIIGSLLGGPVLGGLIGGLLGGFGGGLFGPRPKNPFSATGLTISDDGLLAVGRTFSQLVDTTQEVATLTEQVDQINAFLKERSLKIANAASYDEYNQYRLIGGTSGVWLNFGYGDGRPGSLEDAFGELRFTSGTNARLDKYLSGRSFASFDELRQKVDDVTSFIDTLEPMLLALGKFDKYYGTGTLAEQLKSLNEQYDKAIAIAKDMGESEAALTAARAAAIEITKAAADQAIADTNADLSARWWAAKAVNDNDQRMAFDASLMAFDVKAKAERDQFSDQLLSILGEAGRTSQQYLEQMALLDAVHYQERLALLKRYNDATIEADKQRAQSAALSAVSSLATFSKSLAYSALSPLSQTDQYGKAWSDFITAKQAIASGDFEAMAGFSDTATTFLNASRAIYGSGYQYAQDYAAVQAVLQSVATMKPEDVVASAIKAAEATQTATLGGLLEQIKDKLEAILAETKLQAMKAAA